MNAARDEAVVEKSIRKPMKILSSSSLIIAAALAAATGRSGPTGEAFYGDPPDATHPWAVHDQNRPQPPRVEPGPLKDAKPPEGAVVLFDGTEATLSNWEADKNPAEPTKWIVKDGALQCVPKAGYIRTKAKIGDCQLHIEWAAPTPPEGTSQGRGNSGIFLMGQAEIQVLNNYENPTYADGFACAMYAISPPLANALRAPGEWQQIDITFRRPIFKDGKCVDPGFVTVYCNGVLVQDRVQLEGNTGHMKRPKPNDFGDAAPLKLQDHGNPVRFRNIWYQPLPERTAADVAKTVPMTEAATAAKRKEIAAMVREDAAKKTGFEQALRYGESLVYEKNDDAYGKFETFAKAYAADVKDTQKEEAKHLNRALQYLAKAGIIDQNDAAKTALEGVIKARGWDKK
jgi:hypothetical protein